MAYQKSTWVTGNVIEVEKMFTIKYQGKVSRGPRLKPTSDAMKEINERNARKKLRRLLNTNFDSSCYHAPITYRPGSMNGDCEKAKKDIARFFRKLRKKCAIKYIAVAEHSRRGNIHFHVVLRADGLSTKEIAECWPHGGIYFRNLDSTGDYDALAYYLLKETRNTYFDAERKVFGKRWCESKNLIHPVPKVEKVNAESWRDTPIAPKGYYVIKDSVCSGVSEYTGWPYQYYRCLKYTSEQLRAIERQKGKRR